MKFSEVVECVKNNGTDADAFGFLRQLSLNITRISRADGAEAKHISVGAFIKDRMSIIADTEITHLTVGGKDADLPAMLDAVVVQAQGMFRAEPRMGGDSTARAESYIAVSDRVIALASTDGNGAIKNVTFIVRKS